MYILALNCKRIVMRNKDLILNPYFLNGLFLLVINDFYLKYEYSNFITGKLSDFAGLLIFPLFITYLIPKFKKSITLFIGLGFIIWKTPLVTPIINFINQLLFIPIHRTIDYTDYVALLILPFSYYLINCYENKNDSLIRGKFKALLTYSISIFAFFAFCATSIARPYEMPKGSIYIGESYNIKLPKDSVINTIKRLGYNCEFHKDSLILGESDYRYTREMHYYQTDNIIRYYNQDNNSMILDTIANVKYQLIEVNPNKTKLTIINVTISEDGHIQDWKKLKSLSKQYNSWLKNNLIEKIN